MWCDLCFKLIKLVVTWGSERIDNVSQNLWVCDTFQTFFEKYWPNKCHSSSVCSRMPVSCCAATAFIERSAASFPGLHSSFGLSYRTGVRWPPSSGKW